MQEEAFRTLKETYKVMYEHAPASEVAKYIGKVVTVVVGQSRAIITGKLVINGPYYLVRIDGLTHAQFEIDHIVRLEASNNNTAAIRIIVL